MSGTPDVLVLEGVWGEPFAALAARFRVDRQAAGSGDHADLAARLAGVRALVVRNRTQVDADLLTAAPDLLVVGRAGVGLDNIDLAAADAAGVVVVAPFGANAVSVAEHTLALALALVKGLPAHDTAVRAGGWNRSPGHELAGGTWGLLGAGATARAVAAVAGALGMTVMAYDPYVQQADGIELTGLTEVLRAADVLSVHLPCTDATRNLLDAEALALLKPTAVLVNVGRGEVVDEAALAAALRSGALAGAGLDVRAVEPPEPGPLDGAPHVIMTPHVAGITVESQHRIAQVLADDIAAVLAGESAGHAAGAQTRARTGAR